METGLPGSKPKKSVGRILQKFKHSDGSYTKAPVSGTFASQHRQDPGTEGRPCLSTTEEPPGNNILPE